MERRKLIYDDFGRPTPKTGLFEKEDADFVYLRLENGTVEAISKKKILRMEINGQPASSGSAQGRGV